MKNISTLLKCIPFFALPGLSLAAINMQELEDFSKNFDTRFIETKRPSLADFGWHVIKEGADSTDNRIVQLKGIFEGIINTPWVYNNRNDIKTIYDRFKSLSFDKLTSVSNVLDHFNKVFTDKFEFNFLKSLLLERKFLDEIKADENVLNDFIKSQGNQPVDCVFIRNHIPNENAFRESLKNIRVFIEEGYKVDMLFINKANSFCLNRNKLSDCLQKACASDINRETWNYHNNNYKIPLGEITAASIEPLRWLCTKRQNVSDSDFLALSILRNSLLDKELQLPLGWCLIFDSNRNESLFYLAKFIKAYGEALEKDLQAAKKDIPFYELRLADEELEPSEPEPMDIEEEPAIPNEVEREKPELAEVDWFENDSNNAFANNDFANDKNAEKKHETKSRRNSF